MYIFYNPNPEGKSTGDCVIRALTKALNKSWEQVYVELCLQGYILGDMPSSNSVWSSYLKHNGFKKHLIPDTCPDCYTIIDFTKDFNKGIFLLGTGEHAYSRSDSKDRMVDNLYTMMNEASTDAERTAIQDCINRLKG